MWGFLQGWLHSELFPLKFSQIFSIFLSKSPFPPWLAGRLEQKKIPFHKLVKLTIIWPSILNYWRSGGGLFRQEEKGLNSKKPTFHKEGVGGVGGSGQPSKQPSGANGDLSLAPPQGNTTTAKCDSFVIFAGSESDHCLTFSIRHSVCQCSLRDLIDVTLACEDVVDAEIKEKQCWSCSCCWWRHLLTQGGHGVKKIIWPIFWPFQTMLKKILFINFLDTTFPLWRGGVRGEMV